jgi:hypothetical protein
MLPGIGLMDVPAQLEAIWPICALYIYAINSLIIIWRMDAFTTRCTQVRSSA